MGNIKFEGKVKFFNKEKGYGFLVGPNNSEVFFHITEVQNNEVLDCKDAVTYYVKEGRKGPVAYSVTLVKKAPRVIPPRPESHANQEAGTV
jgi:CspA family cold shock protein